MNQVGDEGDAVQEATEAVDSFPQTMENGTKYNNDLTEKRKRLRWVYQSAVISFDNCQKLFTVDIGSNYCVSELNIECNSW